MGKKRPDLESLLRLASTQSGYFTSSQGARFGIGPALCWHYAKQGSLLRRRRGLYRFSDFGPSPDEEIVAGLLSVGIDEAVVSHDSALALHGLLPLPASVHITIHRSQRRIAPPGVILHTAVRLPPASERTVKRNIPVTTPARSIIDFASCHQSEDEVQAVIHAALELGLTTRTHLLFAAQERSRKVSRVIRRSLEA